MILVTGSAGVIGSSLTQLLHSRNADFIGLTRETFDLSLGHSLIEHITQSPTVIIHLAAAVPHSIHYPDNPLSASKTRTADLAVYHAALHWGARVVYASTCSLYDKTSPLIKYESTPIQANPSSCYLAAKSDGEMLFSTLPSHAILRVPAPIGPGLPSTVVAQKFLLSAVSGNPIYLWGSGNREQNFVDVNDIALMFYLSAVSASHGIFNIAADYPITMRELAEAMSQFNPNTNVFFSGEPDPLEHQYSRYSNHRAYNLLGWRPQTNLNQSIQSMIGAYDVST